MTMELVPNLITPVGISQFLYQNCVPNTLNSSQCFNGKGPDCLIGSGNFGLVFKAKYLLENSPFPYVAVKTIKPLSDINYFKSLLKELKIMIYLGSHENVINLVGACTENLKKREIYIIMELCSKGSLLNYIQKFQPDFINETYESSTITTTERNLNEVFEQCVRFSTQIVKGLQFLKEKHIIHGDLAARNVLVTENLVAKISDFGLSRQLLNYENYVHNKKDAMPWKWVAIEALQFRKFSHESDVWSFGVLLWEIFSFGQTPYPHLTCNEEFHLRISKGYRLARPKFCPLLIYNNIMLECWRLQPWNRILLTDIAEHFLHYSSDSTVDCSSDYTVLEC